MKTALRLIALPVLAASLPAAAHHPMSGATPGNLVEGLLSGFGHPIIGFDHLLFIVAVGIACFYFGQRAITLAGFLPGTLAGTLLHLQAPAAPYAEAWVAASLILLGALFWVRSDFLRGKGALLLFAASGIAHGYAYGEAIVGAEATPLLAYLVGFTLVQLTIASCAFAVARFISTRKPAVEILKLAGGALALGGTGFLAFALISTG